jgi:hypothetical protein
MKIEQILLQLLFRQPLCPIIRVFLQIAEPISAILPKGVTKRLYKIYLITNDQISLVSYPSIRNLTNFAKVCTY